MVRATNSAWFVSCTPAKKNTRSARVELLKCVRIFCSMKERRGSRWRFYQAPPQPRVLSQTSFMLNLMSDLSYYSHLVRRPAPKLSFLSAPRQETVSLLYAFVRPPFRLQVCCRLLAYFFTVPFRSLVRTYETQYMILNPIQRRWEIDCVQRRVCNCH